MSFDRLRKTFTRNVERAISQSFDKSYMEETGEKIIETVVRRTKAGYGVPSNGAAQERLRVLSPGYISFRRGKTLSSTTSPSRSNLTFTGEMLDSLEVTNAGEARVEIAFNNRNAEIKAELVAEQGRPFLNLTRGDIRKLTREFRTRLAGFLSKV